MLRYLLFLVVSGLFAPIPGRDAFAQAPRAGGEAVPANAPDSKPVRLTEEAAKRLLRKAVPANSELPTGIAWEGPTYRDGTSSVRPSWKGKKRIQCRTRSKDEDYQLSCDLRYQATPVTLAEFQARYFSNGYKVCDGLPNGVIKSDPVLRVCHHLYFWQGPHFNGLVYIDGYIDYTSTDEPCVPPHKTRQAQAFVFLKAECQRIAKLICSRLPEATASTAKPDHRALAQEVLLKNLSLWIPQKRGGDELNAIHYKVNEHDGKTYISYVVEWNRQRGKVLGHDFDYEPFVAVLDQNKQVEEVLYDSGHYEVGRIKPQAFKEGKAQFWISPWSHCYTPVKRSTQGQRDWENPSAENHVAVSGDQAGSLLREWNGGRMTIDAMNRNLSTVGTFAGLGIGPDFLSLDQAFDRPWEIKDAFGFFMQDRFGPFARGTVEVRQNRRIQAEQLGLGYKIQTAPEATATIEFKDGSTIVVAPETVYVFKGEPGEPDRFGVGRVRLTSASVGNPGFPVAIKTLHGQIKTVETDYEIQGDFKKTTVRVFKGAVELWDRAKNNKVVIEAGETSLVEGKGKPTKPVKLENQR